MRSLLIRSRIGPDALEGRHSVLRVDLSDELLRLEPSIQIPPVPTQPTKDEVRQAVSLLLDDYLGDFSFADAASRAHALCAICTPLVRRLIAGRKSHKKLQENYLQNNNKCGLLNVLA